MSKVYLCDVSAGYWNDNKALEQAAEIRNRWQNSCTDWADKAMAEAKAVGSEVAGLLSWLLN